MKLQNSKLLEKYLKQFAEIAQEWFDVKFQHLKNKDDSNFLIQYQEFFRKQIFSKDISRLSKNTIEKIASNTLSFKSQEIAEAKAISNLPDNAARIFSELLSDYDTTDIEKLDSEILKRINKATKALKYWGISSVTELIWRKFPEQYTFYNHRDREAIRFLNLYKDVFKYGDKKTPGREFIAYNKFIRKNISPQYEEIVRETVKPTYKIGRKKVNIPLGIQIDQFFSWLYEIKIKQYSDTDNYFKFDDEELNPITFDTISRISINNYFSVKNVEISNFNSKEIYFLGENGVGKTVLFQAILLAAKWNFIKEQTNVEVGIIKDYVKENKELNIECNFTTEDTFYITSKDEYDKNSDFYLRNFFAYGTDRTQVNKEKNVVFEFLSLFGIEKKIINPIEWLIRLNNRELNEQVNANIENYRKDNFLHKTQVIEILSDLLEKQVEIIISFDKVEFIEKGTHLRFEQLSDGYRSVLSWVIDMVARLSENQPNIEKAKDFIGTVLIDELDLFLHPKWAYKIIKKLRTSFPNIQFIISTHSPILILGASKDAIFYKVYKEEGKTQISEPLKDISNLMANSIITSPLFGMEHAYSRAFNKNKETLRLGDDYIYDKIHDFVVNEIKNKNHVEEKDIMDLIREKYNKIKS